MSISGGICWSFDASRLLFIFRMCSSFCIIPQFGFPFGLVYLPCYVSWHTKSGFGIQNCVHQSISSGLVPFPCYCTAYFEHASFKSVWSKYNKGLCWNVTLVCFGALVVGTFWSGQYGPRKKFAIFPSFLLQMNMLSRSLQWRTRGLQWQVCLIEELFRWLTMVMPFNNNSEVACGSRSYNTGKKLFDQVLE